jgi:GNAT superfamily N-acetyltransferase
MSVEVRREPPDAPAGRALFHAYLDLVRARLPGFEPSAEIFAEDDDLSDWLVLYDDGAPVGCGGLLELGPEVCEIKRVFVADGARRRGHGRRLVRELEAIARETGHTRARLYTTGVLHEAIAMYRALGYETASTHAVDGRTDYWMERTLSLA